MSDLQRRLGFFIDEETKARLKHIRDATNVNKSILQNKSDGVMNDISVHVRKLRINFTVTRI